MNIDHDGPKVGNWAYLRCFFYQCLSTTHNGAQILCIALKHSASCGHPSHDGCLTNNTPAIQTCGIHCLLAIHNIMDGSLGVLYIIMHLTHYKRAELRMIMTYICPSMIFLDKNLIACTKRDYVGPLYFFFAIYLMILILK